MFLITIYYISFDIFIFHPSDRHEFIYMYQFYPRLFFRKCIIRLYLYCSKSIKIIKSSFFSPTAKIKFHVEFFFLWMHDLKDKWIINIVFDINKNHFLHKTSTAMALPSDPQFKVTISMQFFGEKKPRLVCLIVSVYICILQ